MKKKWLYEYCASILEKKKFRMMRLCIVFMLGTILQLSAVGVAQTVQLKKTSHTLKAIFDEVERQTGKITLFSNNELDMNRMVKPEADKYDVKELYQWLLQGTNLRWQIEEDYIVIQRQMNEIKLPQVATKRLIKGIVRDQQGNSLPGVSILIKDTQSGVATNNAGEFEILVENNPEVILVFSFIGMESKEMKIGHAEQLNVVLTSEIQGLGEVVVTGYQTISKERTPGSYSVVSPTDMQGKLQMNIMERMEGLVAGLVSYRGDIQIRGISTINGTKTPLYVVDGVPFEGNLDAINPADVVNVTVLKDATAASIYGARSANGVIVITTRRGIPGKMRVNYNGAVKFTPLPDRDYQNLMYSSELVDFQTGIFRAHHESYESVDWRRAESPIYEALYKHEHNDLSDSGLNELLNKYRKMDNYDQIVDEFLRKRKITHQHNLSINGGSDTYQYALSVNYLGDDPYEKAQHTDQVGFNLKNSFVFTDWLKAEVGLIGKQVKEDYDNGVSGLSLLNGDFGSYYMLKDENGKSVQWYREKSQQELDRLTSLGLLDESYFPLNDLSQAHYNYKQQYLNLNVGLNVRILEGLSVDLRYQTEKGNSYTKQYYTKDAWYVRNMINNATQMKDGMPTYNVPSGGQIREVNGRMNAFTMRAQINFNRTFKEIHELTMIAGGERRKVVNESSGHYKVGYDDHNLTYKYIDEATMRSPIYGTEALNGAFGYNVARPPFTNVEDRYVSFYGNASYTFDRRLSASASIRMDQSNLFGTDPKYQYRPLWSAGLQYVIFENKWLWLDRLSARLTYGISGNISKKSGPYLIARAWNYGPNYLINENYTYISTPPNSGLRWEKTKVTNIGVDFQVFKNRLSGTLEYYSKNTSDLLGEKDADPTIGWASVVMNYGDMRNRGVELTLHSRNVERVNFRWTSDLTFSYNKNKVTNIKDQSTSASSYYSELQARENYPIDALFSVRYAGLDENGAPTAYTKDGKVVHSTSELTKDDLVFSGTYDPKYNASFTNTFSYKGIDLSLMFVYYGGHVIRDVAASMYLTYPHTAYITNIDRDNLNYWKAPADSKDIHMHPAYNYNANSDVENIWRAADIHIQKGDFIKLRDVTIGYRLPQQWVQRCRLQKVRVDFQIQNVWRWAANDNKLDPEVWTGGDIYSISRGSLTPTTYTLGLSVNF